MNKVLAILTALLLIAVAPAAATTAARVDIVIPDDNTVIADYAVTMRQALLESPAVGAVSVYTPAQARAAGNNRAALAIVVGDTLLPWGLARDNPYPARLLFHVIAEEFQHSGAAGPQVSAIFGEQPLQRQLRLAKLLLPHLQRVAVIHRAGAAPDLAALGRATGLTVNGTVVDPQHNWAKTLSRLLGDNDILLGLEDPALYNRETIRSILLTTYRHGKVLIGPNQPFVTAGSLASCYTDSDQYLRQLRAAVEFYLAHGALPPAAYPQHYHIAVNRQVAASLGLQLPDQATLIKRMQASGPTQGDGPLHGEGECGDGC